RSGGGQRLKGSGGHDYPAVSPTTPGASAGYGGLSLPRRRRVAGWCTRSPGRIVMSVPPTNLVGTPHRLDEATRTAFPSKPDPAPSEAVRRVRDTARVDGDTERDVALRSTIGERR